MTKQKIITLTVAFLIIAMIGFSLFNGPEQFVKQTYFYMGTVIEITLYGTNDPTALEPVTQLISHYDALLDRDTEGSDIYILNQNKRHQVDPNTYLLIAESLNYASFSDGKFDITINPIVDLWQIGTEDQHIPTASEITSALERVDYHNVILKADSTVELLNNSSIDLGGIAKGFIADEIVQLLEKAGYDKALISLGGNVYAMGSSDKNQAWRIGIRNPELNNSGVVVSIALENKSVVTSGITERYFMDGDILYHHIFDPATGYPLNNELLSISVISETSMVGDVLSTTFYTMGVEKAFEKAKTLENIALVAVTKDKKIYASESLNLELLDSSYELIKK